jgi:glycosyltransferase involved in cell wall biosynthesis
VLVLARNFPPVGGAGVHRTLGTVRYLPGLGYEPVVVTGPGPAADRWSPRDPALLAGVPPGTAIHRLESPEPADHAGWRGRADRWLQRPAPSVSWWVPGATAAGLAAGAGVDVVLASCAPYETALAAAAVARRLDVPWIADLEDPWALDEMRVQPTALHHRADLARMRRALATAAVIVTCAPETAARIRARLPEHAGHTVAIPIGFEPEAFRAPVPSREDDVLRIVHTGSLHTELGQAHRRSAAARRRLGGTSLDVDILTRSHIFLLEAVEQALAAHPDLSGRVEVHLAGPVTEADRAVAAGRPFVTFAGRLGHAETLGLLRSADLLFLPMHELPPGHRAGIIPYKTFEYLASGRPVLAAVPDGDVRDLLARFDHITLCRPSDVAAMAATIAERARARQAGAILQGPGVDEPPLAGLQRPRLVREIAKVLDDVLGVRTPALPAAA